MAQATLTADTLFGGVPCSNTDLSLKFERYLSKLSAAPEKNLSRDEFARFQSEGVIDLSPSPRTAHDVLTKALTAPEVMKGLSGDALASIQQVLETAKVTAPDLVKDFTLSTPIPSGAVAIDLESPMKELAPRPTVLRNRIPRLKGQGTSHRYKALTGFTGSGTGGVAVIHPGIGDTSQNNFAVTGSANNLWYHRGPKISYAGIDVSVPYMQFSVSDEVTWSAQYAGQGYQDIRQVSRTHLLYASMLLEERMMLYGRGTAAPYVGVLTAPTIGTAVARTAAAGEVAITGFTTNVYVKVVAESGDWGVSQTSAAATAAVSAGQVVDITYTLPAGATGARMFVSTGGADPGDASRWFVTGIRSGYNLITLQGALPTSGSSVTAYVTANGGTVNLTTTDGGSAYANGYDGMLAYCTGPTAGYSVAINSALSTVNPGAEFQVAFAQLYDAVKADPDRVLMNGRDRKQLSDALKTATGGPYQLQLRQSELTGVTLGSLVTTIINEVTGKVLDIEVHPWLPQGTAPIISDTLPIPDSHVTNVWAVINVQDYLGMDWPVNQFAYEASSYWYGTMVVFAPGWNGAIRGIKLV